MGLKILVILLSIASQYSPGIMDRVIEKRQNFQTAVHLPERLPSTDGYIAVRDCVYIGDVWWAKSPVNGQWESFLIVDCARPDNSDGTRTWMDERNVAFEVDYETAVRWRTVGALIEVQWATKSPFGRKALEP